jgi:stage II sporulation protein D
MLVYFDTNIFVAGKYHLNTGKFNAVQNLIKSGRIEFLYTSATLGEIEKNLSQDIHEDVIQYNQAKNKIKVITKGMGNNLGLSLYGANDIAKNGSKYNNILKYYFPKVKLLKYIK